MPLHAWLPDAHAEGPTPISAVLSGLLLNVAIYAVLRFKMVMAANPGALAPGPADGRPWAWPRSASPALMLYRRRDIKRLFAYSLDRAHGHHHLRLRHGRPGRQFRRPPAHDHAQPDQVGDLLRGRPRRPGQGHAAPGRHHAASAAPTRCSPGAWRWASVAIAGFPPMGVFMSEFLVVELDLRPPAAAGRSAGARAAGGAGRAAAAAAGHRLRAGRRARRPGQGLLRARCSLIWRWCWSRASGCRHRSCAGSSTWRGCWGERRWPTRCLLDLLGAVRARGRPSAVAALPGHAASCGSISAPASPTAAFDLLALFADAALVHAVAVRARDAARRRRQHRRARRPFPSLGPAAPAGHAARARDPRPLGSRGRRAARTCGPGSTTASGRPAVLRRRRPTRSCRSRARGCTRSRSGRSMPASSSPAISASPATARPWSGSSSGWATSTRGSSACSRGRSRARRPDRRPRLGRQHGGLSAWPSPAPSRRPPASEPPPRAQWLRALLAELERIANHIGDVGFVCNDAAYALLHTHCGMLREEVLQACDDLLRPPADDGPGRARRRRGRSRRRRGAAPAATGRSGCARRFAELEAHYDGMPSLQDRTVGTGIVTARARAPVRGRRLCRPRLGPGLRCPPRRSPTRPTTGCLRGAGTAEGDVNARVWIRMREIEQSLAPDRADSRRPARGAASGAGRHRAPARAWRFVEGVPRRRAGLAAARRRTGASCAATRATRPGSSGRCSRPRSRATSSPTSPCATRASTAPTRATTCEPRAPAQACCAARHDRRRPAADDAALRRARRAARPGGAAAARPLAGDPRGRCRLLQRLRARDQPLNNAVYDLERFGIRFVASPRHADVLLVTGPVTRNMREALERTWDCHARAEMGGGRGRLRHRLRLSSPAAMHRRRRRRRGGPGRPPHRRLPALATSCSGGVTRTA